VTQLVHEFDTSARLHVGSMRPTHPAVHLTHLMGKVSTRPRRLVGLTLQVNIGKTLVSSPKVQSVLVPAMALVWW
jgi:hypothetical protein